jgi:hypothetical protein
MSKTVHSRFNHEVGERVEGCQILEKSIIAPPNPRERRRGIYDYIVEMPAIIGTPRPLAKRCPHENPTQPSRRTREQESRGERRFSELSRSHMDNGS